MIFQFRAGEALYDYFTQGSRTSTPLAPALPYSVDERFVDHLEESIPPLREVAVSSYLHLQDQALEDAWYFFRSAVSYQHTFASVALLQIVHILREFFDSGNIY